MIQAGGEGVLEGTSTVTILLGLNPKSRQDD